MKNTTVRFLLSAFAAMILLFLTVQAPAMMFNSSSNSFSSSFPSSGTCGEDDVRCNEVLLAVKPITTTVSVGETFSLTLQVEAEGVSVDGASAYLDFDPNVVEVISITASHELGEVIENQFDNINGTISYSAGFLPPNEQNAASMSGLNSLPELTESKNSSTQSSAHFPSGTFILATIHFTALAEGQSTLIFAREDERFSDVTNQGESVLGGWQNGMMTVVMTATATPTPTATATATATHTPTPTPTQNPSPIIDASVTLQGRPSPPHSRWVVPLRVSLTIPGEDTPAYEFTPTTDENGDFTLTGIEAGTYEIRVKHAHTLQNVQTVTLAAGSNTIDLGILREGDANDDNYVTIIDFSILAATFGICEGTDGYDARADFNGDGCITIIDFSLLASNFGQGGQNAAMTPSRASEVSPSDVAMSISPAQTSIQPGDTFIVTVKLDAGEQQVDGAQIGLNFDPDVLTVEEVMTGDKLALELANQVDNEGGIIQFAAGTLQEFPSGEINIMDIQFRALKEGETALAFDATADRAMGSDVTFGGASVLGELTDSVVTVNEPTAVTIGDISTHTTINSLLAALALLGLAGLGGVFARRNR